MTFLHDDSRPLTDLGAVQWSLISEAAISSWQALALAEMWIELLRARTLGPGKVNCARPLRYSHYLSEMDVLSTASNILMLSAMLG